MKSFSRPGGFLSAAFWRGFAPAIVLVAVTAIDGGAWAKSSKYEKLIKQFEISEKAGDWMSALSAGEEIIDAIDDEYAKDDPYILPQLNRIGQVYLNLHRLSDAEARYEQAQQIIDSGKKVGWSKKAQTYLGLGWLRLLQDKEDEATRHFDEVVKTVSHYNGRDSADLAVYLGRIADAYRHAGKDEAALGHYMKSYQVRRKIKNTYRDLLVDNILVRAQLNARLQHLEDAEKLLKTGKAQGKRAYEKGSVQMVGLKGTEARIAYFKKDFKTAEPLLREAIGQSAQFAQDYPNRTEYLMDLAEILVQKQDHAAAEPLYKEALATLEKNLGTDHPRLVRPLEGLAGLYAAMGEESKAADLRDRIDGLGKSFGLDTITNLFK